MRWIFFTSAETRGLDHFRSKLSTNVVFKLGRLNAIADSKNFDIFFILHKISCLVTFSKMSLADPNLGKKLL